MARVTRKVKKGSKSVTGNGNNNTNKTPKRNSVISPADRKRNKIKVEKLNNQTDLSVASVAELNESIRLKGVSVGTLSRQDRLRRNTDSALHAEKLARDHAHDTEIQKRIEQQNKDVEDSLLKQIETMSGFSL